ncbi:alpha-glucosidase [Edaphobacter aggregans]|uniref:Alpha-glucosidase n=1 Tax=Edaphobacter aggregans TaxID=570835 RepID=A0A3R9PWE0_9BACT|nr:TIM-barrel domain-containing protein [Edaphobacter aggregans]RSL19331.1 alpha-glucosidase [Edaphobacter aggregans]
MKKQYTLFFALVFLATGFFGVEAPCEVATSAPSAAKISTVPELIVLRAVTGSKQIGNGVEIRSENAVMQVTALRDDVLRVRVGIQGQLPEDASWAVLPTARTASVRVFAEEDSASVGFRTGALRIKVDRSTMRLRITDLKGTLIQEDAIGHPVEFHGSAFRVYKTMAVDEHFFGLGDKPGSLDRRDHSYSLWNTDSFGFQESTDPIYKSIPFFLTSRGGTAAGVLLDNTWRTSFDFGREYSDAYSFGSEGGPLDYYILYGPDAKHVLSTYAWLTGPTPLPPLWSFGFQQSRYSYHPESEVRKIADRLRADRIPADALYLDIDYQDHYRPFTVDQVQFPHFAQMIEDLRKQNLRVVAITDLHIAHLPDANYTPYDSGMTGDHFVKKPDSSVYIGKVWPGPSVFPDFTRESTRKWWGSLYADFVHDGIAGFWNDMNEPSIFDTPNKTMPDNVQHRIDEPGFRPRTTTHLEIHDVYGMENSRATYDGLLALTPNQRPFVLTRASYAGGQRYAATWTGDNSSTWNHLRLTTPMLLNLGLSGFGMSGADVGGFVGSPGAELLTKWIELGTFQPIDRDHASDTSANQEVWVDGAEQEDIRRRYIEERYKLLPYLYTTAEEMSRTGLPIVRPLFLEFPDATADKHPIDLDAPNEFLFGANMLIAPGIYPEKPDTYPVRLPSVDWYNYWTGEKIGENMLTADSSTGNPSGLVGRQITIKPQLDVLPVFVREGSILPMQPLTQSTIETPKGPLTLRVYPGKNCTGSIYLDDGLSFAYKNGDFLRMAFSCVETPKGITVHVGPHQGSYVPWWTSLRVEVYGSTTAGKAVVAGSAQTVQTSFDAPHHVAAFTLPDSGQGEDLQIEWIR